MVAREELKSLCQVPFFCCSTVRSLQQKKHLRQRIKWFSHHLSAHLISSLLNGEHKNLLTHFPLLCARLGVLARRISPISRASYLIKVSLLHSKRLWRAVLRLTHAPRSPPSPPPHLIKIHRSPRASPRPHAAARGATGLREFQFELAPVTSLMPCLSNGRSLFINNTLISFTRSSPAGGHADAPLDWRRGRPGEYCCGCDCLEKRIKALF